MVPVLKLQWHAKGNSGVPQGYVLGLAIFKTCTNYLFEATECKWQVMILSFFFSSRTNKKNAVHCTHERK